MRLSYLSIPVLSLCLACCTGEAGLEHRHDHGHDHETHHESLHGQEHEHQHEGDEHGHEHAAGTIVLHDELAERFGVEVDTLQPAPFSAAVRASGTVMTSAADAAVVSAPVAGIVNYAGGITPGAGVRRGTTIATIDATGVSGGNAGATARAALEAAQSEYDRIEALYADRLATVGERNAAYAALCQAKAQYSPSAAAGRAVSPLAGVVSALTARQGQYVGAGEAIATVSGSGSVTLRIDLPRRHAAMARSFTAGTIELPYGGGTVDISALGARQAGVDAAGSTASAFVPVYFTAPATAALTPGTAFTAWLSSGTATDALVVPVEALSEQQGEYFVYEALDDEHYVKRPVAVTGRNGRQAAITGLAPGTPVVVKGTVTVRLAENGANIPEGHTHNH